MHQTKDMHIYKVSTLCIKFICNHSAEKGGGETLDSKDSMCNKVIHYTNYQDPGSHEQPCGDRISEDHIVSPVLIPKPRGKSTLK